MKNLCIVLLQGLLFCFSVYARFKVDGIKAKVYGPTETYIVTESEVNRPGLDGQAKSFDELIFEYLVFSDAKRIGAVPDAAAMEHHWEEVKRSNSLSEDDMKQLAAQAGYTLQEAKAQLGKMSAISQMFSFKVQSSLFVPKHKVEAYYKANPITEPAEYEIARALVPYSDLESKESMSKRLTSFVHTGRGKVRIAWSNPFWLMHDEIAEHLTCIYAMKVGQISEPLESSQGFELFKLEDKKPARLVPLSERYNEIENVLKRPKYEELMNKYKSELYDKATVVVY